MTTFSSRARTSTVGTEDELAANPRLQEARELLRTGGELERGGEVERAVEVLLQAQAMLAEEGPIPLSADLQYRTGILRARLGQTDQAERHFDQSLETASWCGYTKGQAYAINGLGVVAQRRGDIDGAESHFRRAGRLATECSEHRLCGMVEQNLGVLANIRGDLDSALVHYQSGLNDFDQAGDDEGVCWMLNNMGMLQTDLGRYDEAENTLSRGLELARKLADRVSEGALQLNRIEAFIGLGRLRPAGQACKAALALAAEREDTLQTAEALKYRGIIERERNKLEASLATLEEAGRLAEKTHDKLLRAEILRERGETLYRSDQSAQARLHMEYAIRQFTELDAVLDSVDVRRRLQEWAAEAAGAADPAPAAAKGRSR